MLYNLAVLTNNESVMTSIWTQNTYRTNTLTTRPLWQFWYWSWIKISMIGYTYYGKILIGMLYINVTSLQHWWFWWWKSNGGFNVIPCLYSDKRGILLSAVSNSCKEIPSKSSSHNPQVAYLAVMAVQSFLGRAQSPNEMSQTIEHCSNKTS